MAEPVAPGPALVDAVTATPATTATAAGVLLPLLVGLLTTRGWPAPARGLMLFALAFALAGGAVAVQRATADAGTVLGPAPWGQILGSTFTTWVAAQTAHQSLWRKTAVSAWLQALGTRRPPHPERGTVATIRRAQGAAADSAPEPGRLERQRPARTARDEVRPRPTRPRDAQARAEQRVRITRPPDVDPSPSGRHARGGGNDPPTSHDS